MEDMREREEAENRRKRIECRHQTGEMFESAADLRWLYFDLSLRGVDAESELKDFIREPIWESVYSRDCRRACSDDLIKQAARYVDRPLFHCTALRDFFVIRLTESLLAHVHDPIRDRVVLALRKLMTAFLIALTIVLYLLVNWWTAAIVAFLLAIKALGWLKEIENKQQCQYRNRFTRDRINELVATLKRGGYDEPSITSIPRYRGWSTFTAARIFSDQIKPGKEYRNTPFRFRMCSMHCFAFRAGMYRARLRQKFLRSTSASAMG
jgi:hypothetical protein